MGALTVAIKSAWWSGDRRYVRGTITFSSSYSTGGDTYTLGNFRLSALDQLLIQDTGSTAQLVSHDRANKKLLLFVESAGTISEAANGSDQSGVSVEFIAIGRG